VAQSLYQRDHAPSSSRYDGLHYGFADVLKAITTIILTNKKKDELPMHSLSKRKLNVSILLHSCDDDNISGGKQD